MKSKNIIDAKYYPTGSCFPFSKKIFLTAQGYILPCEKIGFQFKLGEIIDGNVLLDVKEVAKKYNTYFEGIRVFCNKCYDFKNCRVCIFNDGIISDNLIECPHHVDDFSHPNVLSHYWSFLEKRPNLYLKIVQTLNYE